MRCLPGYVGAAHKPLPAHPHHPLQPIPHCPASGTATSKPLQGGTDPWCSPLKKKASPRIWATASKCVLHLLGTSRLSLWRDAQVSRAQAGSEGLCPSRCLLPHRLNHPCSWRRLQAVPICHTSCSRPATCTRISKASSGKPQPEDSLG